MDSLKIYLPDRPVEAADSVPQLPNGPGDKRLLFLWALLGKRNAVFDQTECLLPEIWCRKARGIGSLSVVLRSGAIGCEKLLVRPEEREGYSQGG